MSVSGKSSLRQFTFCVVNLFTCNCRTTCSWRIKIKPKHNILPTKHDCQDEVRSPRRWAPDPGQNQQTQGNNSSCARQNVGLSVESTRGRWRTLCLSGDRCSKEERYSCNNLEGSRWEHLNCFTIAENHFVRLHTVAHSITPRDHFRILINELDLACNGGSCGEIHEKKNICTRKDSPA